MNIERNKVETKKSIRALFHLIETKLFQRKNKIAAEKKKDSPKFLEFNCPGLRNQLFK